MRGEWEFPKAGETVDGLAVENTGQIPGTSATGNRWATVDAIDTREDEADVTMEAQERGEPQLAPPPPAGLRPPLFPPSGPHDGPTHPYLVLTPADRENESYQDTADLLAGDKQMVNYLWDEEERGDRSCFEGCEFRTTLTSTLFLTDWHSKGTWHRDVDGGEIKRLPTQPPLPLDEMLAFPKRNWGQALLFRTLVRSAQISGCTADSRVIYNSMLHWLQGKRSSLDLGVISCAPKLNRLSAKAAQLIQAYAHDACNKYIHYEPAPAARGGPQAAPGQEEELGSAHEHADLAMIEQDITDAQHAGALDDDAEREAALGDHAREAIADQRADKLQDRDWKKFRLRHAPSWDRAPWLNESQDAGRPCPVVSAEARVGTWLCPANVPPEEGGTTRCWYVAGTVNTGRNTHATQIRGLHIIWCSSTPQGAPQSTGGRLRPLTTSVLCQKVANHTYSAGCKLLCDAKDLRDTRVSFSSSETSTRLLERRLSV